MFIHWPIDYLDWLMLVGWLSAWLAGWLVSWLVGWLVAGWNEDVQKNVILADQIEKPYAEVQLPSKPNNVMAIMRATTSHDHIRNEQEAGSCARPFCNSPNPPFNRHWMLVWIPCMGSSKQTIPLTHHMCSRQFHDVPRLANTTLAANSSCQVNNLCFVGFQYVTCVVVSSIMSSSSHVFGASLHKGPSLREWDFMKFHEIYFCWFNIFFVD